MLLLDTCTVIWTAEDRSKLSQHVQTRLATGGPEAPVVSAMSAFEIAVNWAKGKLALPLDPLPWFDQVVRSYGLRVEPVTWEDGVRAALLPRHHNDPMDRIIVAAAMRIGASVVTPDPLIARYAEVQTTW